uniref:Integrator complex subunit 6 n=1 Tax=Stegastes partitus TaxID=144197 RepID=A0A3B5AFQ8_9TELE
MPVLLFLIDTSASMNQRTHLGTTYLDIAKGAVETFMKLRGRDPASRGDRYMLVNFEDVPFGIKAGWKESHATFMTELRNLQATGLTSIGQSLRTAFDLLNLNRLVTGIDNYGQVCSAEEGRQALHLPLTTPLPGSELTKEPFRWDQRLFALVLRIPGNTSVEPEPLGGVPPDDSPITPMCEVTGGRSYSVFSQRMLNQCLESLVQKIQSGVVINFEKTGPDPPPLEAEALKSGPQPWHCSHKLIYVRPNPKTGVPIGHWPIPEAFWPDQNSPTLPPRSAHPHVRFSCLDAEPMVIDKVPFDKYELEPSPLTQYILERKSPHTCWQVFVCNSAKYSDLGQPFGYLKASTALNCVNLFVMPYNYPVLLPLLDDLIKVHKFKPTIKWRQSFENYLKTMPPYYIGSLRKALRIMGAPNLLADNMEYGLSYSVVSYLKKLSQQSKIEYDRLIALIGKKPPSEAGIKVRWRGGGISLAQRRDFIQQLQSLTGDAPALPLELNPKEFQGFHLALLNKGLKPHSFRNPYDIPRSHLLDQLSRMRRNLLNTGVCTLRGQDSDQLHSVPVAQMGNYQDFLKAAPQPLRDADPEQPKRLHTFGNPFKLDKKGMMIDEADEFVTGPQNKGKRPADSSNMTGGGPKRRRCMSPLLRLGRAYTPPVTPPNHYGSDGSSDSEVDHPSGPGDLQENHTAADLQVIRHGDEEENGQPQAGELPLGSEGGAEMMLMEDQPARYLSPAALKKHIHTETTKVNNELRALITKEIRKPGRHYEKIFLLLKQIQGTLDTRLIFLQNIIKEAARFKKRVLIEQLENFLEEIHNRSNNMNHVDTL